MNQNIYEIITTILVFHLGMLSTNDNPYINITIAQNIGKISKSHHNVIKKRLFAKLQRVMIILKIMNGICAIKPIKNTSIGRAFHLNIFHQRNKNRTIINCIIKYITNIQK